VEIIVTLVRNLVSEKDYAVEQYHGNAWKFLKNKNFNWPDGNGAFVFRNIQEKPRNSRPQKGDMQQIPYWGPTNIRRYCTKMYYPGRFGPRDLCSSPINKLYFYLFLKYFYWCAFVGLLHCINIQIVFAKCTSNQQMPIKFYDALFIHNMFTAFLTFTWPCIVINSYNKTN